MQTFLLLLSVYASRLCLYAKILVLENQVSSLYVHSSQLPFLFMFTFYVIR